MRLRVKLLGLLHITDENGTASEIMRWQKGCALLAYLIVTSQPQRREHLADLLWNAPSTTQSLQNLRKLLSRLRKWMPGLDVTRQQVAYDLTTAVAIDYLTLSEALNSGSVAQIEVGLRLYGGDLLQGFYLDDAPRFNEWLLLEREGLRQRVTAAYRQICITHSEQSAWAQGIAAAQAWLALDELDEEALRHLLQFLAASGQIEVALQQYESSRRRLWNDLAVEPAPQTVQLAQRLQALKEKKGSGLSWSAIVGAQMERPSPGQLAESGDLPLNAYVPYQRNNDFTGRRKSLLRLAELLLPYETPGGPRVVAVTGMGGMGKTQLVVEFCYRYGRYFPGGVFWFSFADAQNVPSEVAAVGGERGMGLYQDADRLTQTDKVGRVCKAWQEAIPRLLIFDNCEEEELLVKWLPVSGGSRVLLTSRRSQWAHELGVERHRLDTLSRAESVALLEQLAPDAVTGAGAIIQEIAAELGDLPLALHLAGSFLRRYERITAQQYLAQVKQMGVLHHPSLQGHGSSYSPTGHALHVARTFAINSAQLAGDNPLDQMARQLLAHAACFAPNEGIPHALLQATVPPQDEHDLMSNLLAEDGIDRLQALGFLRSEGAENLLMHPLVAAFVRDDLAEMATAAATVRDTLIKLMQTHRQTTDSLFALPLPANQLRYVTNNSLPNRDQQAAALASLFGQHLTERLDFEGAFDYLDQARAIYEQLGEEYEVQRAVAYTHLGTHFLRKGEFEKADMYYQQALLRLQAIPTADPIILARAYKNLSAIHAKLGRAEEALTANQKALTIFEETLGWDHFETVRCLRVRGTMFVEMGAYEQSQAPYERALASYQHHLGTENISAARVQANLGWVYLQLGDFSRAQTTLEQAYDIQATLLGPQHQRTLSALHSLGQLYYEQGDYERAESILRQGFELRRQIAGLVHHTTAFMQTDLGRVLRATGHYREAHDLLRAALATREQIYGRQHSWTARALNHLGKLYLMMGNFEQARPLLEEALAFHGSHRPQSANMADVLDNLGDLLTYLRQAKAMREEVQGKEHPKLAYTLNRLARWHRAVGELETAQQLAVQAMALLEPAVHPLHLERQAAHNLLSQIREA